MPDFWELDSISDEFINGCLTFLDFEHGHIQKRYQGTIPDYCSSGTILNLEIVRVERAYRGCHLGLDALTAYLELLLWEEDWTFIFTDISPCAKGDEDHDIPTKGALRRYFERRLPFHNANNRYHWLAVEEFRQSDSDFPY